MTPSRTTDSLTLQSVWLYHGCVQAATSAGTSTTSSGGYRMFSPVSYGESSRRSAPCPSRCPRESRRTPGVVARASTAPRLGVECIVLGVGSGHTLGRFLVFCFQSHPPLGT